MYGVTPKMGDIVRITERAAIRFANEPVPEFRVIDVELVADREGWCRITGWDLRTPGVEVTHCVLVTGLIVRPGDGWNDRPAPAPG